MFTISPHICKKEEFERIKIKKRDDDDSSIVDKIYLYVKDPNELIQRILMYY